MDRAGRKIPVTGAGPCEVPCEVRQLGTRWHPMALGHPDYPVELLEWHVPCCALRMYLDYESKVGRVGPRWQDDPRSKDGV